MHAKLPPAILPFLKETSTYYTKLAPVFLSFMLVILLTSLFMSRMLNDRLQQNVNDTVSAIQTTVSNVLLMQNLPMYYISENIQDMLRRGESFALIKAYMVGCSSPAYKERINFFYNNIYGYFHDYGVYFNGGRWIPDDSFIPKDRPWYKAAVEANGKIALAPPYLDANSKMMIISSSRLLTDERGRPLAAVSMSVPLTRITDIIASRQITQDGFGWMMDENMVFIIHPDPQLVNKSMREISRFAGAVEKLQGNAAVSMQRYVNNKEEKSFLFIRRLTNGWFVGLTIPEADYYREMYTMIGIISLVCLVMATFLSVILVRMDKAKLQSDVANQQKSDFLATMSHEIRTPMNTIMGITEMRLHEEHLPDALRESFDRIHSSGDLLLNIINGLLDLSKIEAGKLELVPAQYDVPSLLHDVIQLVKLRFDSAFIELKLDIGGNVPVRLIGDELRIRQVLHNLLSNAFKYTDSGVVEFSVHAETGDRGEATLVFVVSDTGQGLTEQQIAVLFDRFTRFNLEKNRTIEGVGLGMNITYNLVYMMNGSIQVESQPGRGSVFTVRLPQGVAADSRTVVSREMVENLARQPVVSTAQVKKARLLRRYMPYGRVLIVDDTEANLYVAKLIMAPYGLKIGTAASGYEAVELIRGGCVYDIIFMDHMMPGMDGIETVRILRGMGYAEPIIALTANAVVGQAEVFLAKGFDAFISKPIDMRLLDMMLNKHIYVKQTPDVLAAAELEKERLEKERAEAPPEAGPEARQAGGREALPFDMPRLNTGRGLALFDDDPDTYVSALRSYVRNAPEIIEKLRVVTEEGLPEYAINVHGLKSISGWISADGIRSKAASLELLAKAGDLFGVTTLNTDFLDEIEAFISELRFQLEHY